MITLLAWIMLGAQINTTSKPAHVPLSINISTSASKVPYGSFIVFKLVLTNRTDHQIDCSEDWSESVDLTYAFEITNLAGKKILRHVGPMEEGSSISCTLDPGATKSWEQVIEPSSYPQLVPGEYRIQIATQNPDDPHGEKLYSNTVDIDIQPRSAHPAK